MAEEYKVLIGAEAKKEEFDAVEKLAKDISNKEYPIHFKVDSKAEDHLNTLKRTLDKLGDTNLNLDLGLNVQEIASVKKGLVGLGNSIDSISKAFNSLGRDGIMGGLIGSIQQMPFSLNIVNSSLEEIRQSFNDVTRYAEAMNESLERLSHQNLRIDFGLDERLTAGERAALFDEEARNVIPLLRNQVEEIYSSFGENGRRELQSFINNVNRYSTREIIDRTNQLNNLESRVNTGFNSNGRALSFSEQITDLRTLIDLLHDYQQAMNINPAGFEHNVDEIQNALRRLQDIRSGQAERNATANRLRDIFGTNFDPTEIVNAIERVREAIERLEQICNQISANGINLGDLPAQLTTINSSLEVLNNSIGEIDNNTGIQNLVQEFQALSNVMRQAADACLAIQNSLNTSTQIQDLANVLNSLPQALGQLNNLAGSIFDLSQAILVLNQECDRINLAMTQGAQAAQRLRNAYGQIPNGMSEIGAIDLHLPDDNQIDRMRETLQNLGFDNIDTQNISRGLDEIFVRVNKIRTSFNQDGSLRMVVSGMDKEGRDVTATSRYRRFVEQDGSERFVLDSDPVIELTERFNGAELACQDLLDVITRIGSTEIKLAGLDPEKDIEQISQLTHQLELLCQERDRLFGEASVNNIFGVNELGRINDATERMADRVETARAKQQDRIRNQQEKAEEKKAKETEKNLEDTKNKIKSKADEIADIEIKIDALKINEGSQAEIDKYTASLQKLREEYNSLYRGLHGQSATPVLTDEAIKKIDEGKEYNQKIKAEGIAKQAEKISIDFKAKEFDITKIKNDFDGLKTKTDETKTAVKGLEEALSKLDEAVKSNNNSQIIEAKKVYDLARKTAENAIKRDANAEKKSRKDSKLEIDKRAFESGMDVWLNKNSEAADYFADKIANIRQRLKECDATELTQLRTEFTDLKRQAELAGKTVKSFGDRLSDQFKRFGTYFALDNIIDEAVQGIRDMYDQVVQIDTAMTDLYKVTDETPERYEQFLVSAQKGAKELGRSVSSYITQSAKWAQMGYGIGDSEQLAKISSIYSNVADVTDETAVGDIVATLKAFDLATSDAITIVDSLNKLGKLMPMRNYIG